MFGFWRGWAVEIRGLAVPTSTTTSWSPLPLRGEGLLVFLSQSALFDNPSGASRPFAQGSHLERLFTVLLEEVLDAGLNFFWG